MTPEDQARTLQLCDHAILMLTGHPYRALHGDFPILLTTKHPFTRNFAFMLIKVITTRLENQPLPSQKHYDSLHCIWTHYRTEAETVDDQEVVDVIDHALDVSYVWNPSMADRFFNPTYDHITGEPLESPTGSTKAP